MTHRALFLFVLVLGACASASATSIDSLIDTVPEPPGVNCPQGGLAVLVGIDRDKDQILDPDEVKKTSYVCNGATAHGSLSAIASEATGANCPQGGVKITSGVDDNGNGTLDPTEVDSTKYVCNGASGTSGSAGQLLDVVTEAAGANCTAGGLKILSGTDTDKDGTLDASEVTDTSYVCNGDPAAANGTTPIVTAYMNDVTTVPANGSSVTARTASITVPRQGRLLVIWSADVYCTTPAVSMGYDCGPAANDGYITLTAVASDAANTADFSYFALQANVTETVSRTAVYTIPTAGTYTFYVRAARGNDSGSRFGLFRTQITLAFTPN